MVVIRKKWILNAVRLLIFDMSQRNVFEKVFSSASFNIKSQSQRRGDDSPLNLSKGSENLAGNLRGAADVETPKRQLVKSSTTQELRSSRSVQSVRSPLASASQSDSEQDPEVKVFLRLRPLLGSEEKADLEIQDNIVLARPLTRGESDRHFAERSYTFTKVFDSDATQEMIFEEVAMPLLKRFVRGIDALLFAYGATSAGKTFTVKGTDSDPGLLPRMVKSLLTQTPPKNTERGLLVSCVEVYNERIHDLLGDPDKPLRVGKDAFGYTTVKGVSEIELKSLNDLNQAIKTIDQVRRSSSTSYNATSSRSHCIFMLKLVTIPLDPETGQRTSDFSQIRCTRLSIVDLAGSERVSTTETISSKTISEACNINKSMLVLGKCLREIRKVNSGLVSQIPFRESKLTEMFRDFFEPGKGRSTSCSIIINISPAIQQFDDTLFSLQFAAEAVECHVRDKEEDCDEPLEDSESAEEEDTQLVDQKTLQLAEARIREEIQAEMSERLRRIQSEYQEQLEQIRLQSQQPYTSKLQQALALRMQTESKNRELEECLLERDNERQKAQELRAKLGSLRKQIDEAKAKLEEVASKNAVLEGSIQKMIEATKALHKRQLDSQAELEDKAAKIDMEYKNRVEALEKQIAMLKQQL